MLQTEPATSRQQSKSTKYQKTSDPNKQQKQGEGHPPGKKSKAQQGRDRAGGGQTPSSLPEGGPPNQNEAEDSLAEEASGDVKESGDKGGPNEWGQGDGGGGGNQQGGNTGGNTA